MRILLCTECFKTKLWNYGPFGTGIELIFVCFNSVFAFQYFSIGNQIASDGIVTAAKVTVIVNKFDSKVENGTDPLVSALLLWCFQYFQWSQGVWSNHSILCPIHQCAKILFSLQWLRVYIFESEYKAKNESKLLLLFILCLYSI